MSVGLAKVVFPEKNDSVQEKLSSLITTIINFCNIDIIT